MDKRILFLGGCIPVRLSLAYLAYSDNPFGISDKINHTKILGVILILIGLSFLYLWTFNKRLNAPEGGGVTWWAKYRIIHAINYLTAGILLLCAENYKHIAGGILLFDTITGLLLELNK